MNDFLYSDGMYGPARDFTHEGMDFGKQFLERRQSETEQEWIDRLALVGVAPVRHLRDYDATTHESGVPSAPVKAADGWAEISFPAPVAKTIAWDKITRHPRYFVQGEEIADAYTTEEPPHPVYSKWDGAGWVRNVDEAKTDKLAAIKAEADKAINNLPKAERYCAGERLTWEAQLEEAKAYLAAPDTAVTPGLDAMVARSGESKAVLAQEIMDNKTAWTVAALDIVGQRQKLTADLEAAAGLSSGADALAAIEAVLVVYA